MITMTDVAKYARVSKMTVSRVLNGSGYVKEETRQAVMEAVHALGYRPNLLAKSLTTGRSNIIAYVLPDISDPFFSNVCKGISDVCDKQGFNSFVYSAPNADSVEGIINMVMDRRIDGVIFHHLCVNQEQVQLLTDNGIKVATIDNEYHLDNTIDITNDNYRGAYEAAEYLIGQGYRRIACIHGALPQEEQAQEAADYVESFQQRIWADRTAGFVDALKKHGLEPFGMYYGRGSARIDKVFLSGQQVMKQILEQPELPDAVYCESDLLALGMLGEMLERNVSCPNTIALCGYDGLDICRFLYPRITTVAQPQYEIGLLAAESLINAINEKKQEAIPPLSPTLFIGDTTK